MALNNRKCDCISVISHSMSKSIVYCPFDMVDACHAKLIGDLNFTLIAAMRIAHNERIEIGVVEINGEYSLSLCSMTSHFMTSF